MFTKVLILIQIPFTIYVNSIIDSQTELFLKNPIGQCRRGQNPAYNFLEQFKDADLEAKSIRTNNTDSEGSLMDNDILDQFTENGI